MARTPTSKRSSRTSEKPAARGRPAGKRTAAKPAGKRTAEPREPGHPKSHTKSITKNLRSLMNEVHDLRSMRSKYNQLLAEHNGLVGTLRSLSAEIAGSARTAWNDYRGNGKNAAGPRPRTARRVRTASADVDAMTAKLMSVVPAEWKTKEAICSAASLDPKSANTAFRRLVMGYARNGAKVPPVLEANGKRGTDGRYRRAGNG